MQRNELLTEIRWGILSSEVPPLWLLHWQPSRKKFQTEIMKSKLPMGRNLTTYWGITLEILNKEIQWYFHQKCYLIVISIKELILVTTIFPPPPGPLRGFLTLSCMEDYFMIELSVCGGEIGPLSMSTDLGHRHLLGSCL